MRSNLTNHAIQAAKRDGQRGARIRLGGGMAWTRRTPLKRSLSCVELTLDLLKDAQCLQARVGVNLQALNMRLLNLTVELERVGQQDAMRRIQQTQNRLLILRE